MLFHFADHEASATLSETEVFACLLVDRIKNGDIQAEAELVDKFGKPVRLVLRRFCRNAADEDDLFQDTFHIALRKIRDGQLRRPRRLGGFLVKLAQYSAIDFYRKASKHLPKEEQQTLKSTPSNPLHSLITKEQCSRLLQAIPELRCPRDRAVLQRFYLAEEDKSTICEDLGISFGNFNQIIYRAKKRLKKLLLKDIRLPKSP